MRKLPPLLLLLTLLFAVVWLCFSDILLHPNAYLFDGVGDALKSYYCTAYYTRYNQGLHFTGLNYPFGEVLLFTDGQPVLAETLRLLHRHLGMPAHYSIGVINTAIILSLPVAGLVVYRLLRMHRLPGLYSVAAALCITFLSPQIYRFNAHMSLSQVYFVPVVWYLIIRIFGRTSPLWLLWYVLFTLLMGGFHPYLVAISAMFLLSYVLVYALQERQHLRRDWRFLAAALVAAVLPVALFNAFVAAADPVADRPNNPFGFFDYYATPSSVFNPIEAWQQMNGISSPRWEGFAYVGLVGLCVALLTLARFIGKGRRGFGQKRWQGLGQVFRPVLPAQLRVALWAAILMLLFAFCMPFRIEGFRWIPELVPPLKQFRSLGRFAWIFYYVFSVYSAFYLYQLHRCLSRRGLRQFGTALVLLAFLIWWCEAYATVSFKANTLRHSDSSVHFTGEHGNYHELLAKAGVQASEFQAILPLPFTHIGSEVLWVPGEEITLQQAMFASYHTGLPVASVMLSRTSYSQTVDLLRLVSNPLLPRPLLERLPSEKPFLLIVTNHPLSGYEAALAAKAELLLGLDSLRLYRLPVSAMRSTARQEAAGFQAQKSQLHTPSPGLYLSQICPDVVSLGFQVENASPSFLDPGALYARKGPLVVHSAALPGASDTATYEVSLWIHLSSQNAPDVRIKELGQQGNALQEVRVEMKESVDVYKGWVRTTGFIRLQDKGNRIEVGVYGRKLTVDNLLIRPRSCDVFYQPADTRILVKNNMPVEE